LHGRTTPKSDTRAETEVRKILEDLGRFHHTFESQVPIKTRFSPRTFIVDFLLDEDTVIEVHADHKAKWNTKTRRDKDAAKRECLLAERYFVIDIIGTDRQIARQANIIRNAILDSYKYNLDYTRIDLSTEDGIPVISHDSSEV
jgi:hypothetical protein